MHNRVELIGNVGKDPEIRATNSGNKVASFSLATSETWKDKNSGERKERTEWHRIVVWGDGLVGVIEKYVKKGSQLFIEGQLQTRKWQDKEGRDQYTTEIVVQGLKGGIKLLGRKGDGNGRRDDPGPSDADAPSAETNRKFDDEIPF